MAGWNLWKLLEVNGGEYTDCEGSGSGWRNHVTAGRLSDGDLEQNFTRQDSDQIHMS